jgi:DNA ligase (NAD+)
MLRFRIVQRCFASSSSSKKSKKLGGTRANDIVKLRELIAIHNNLYYNDAAPIIADDEYDQLVLRLKQLESLTTTTTTRRRPTLAAAAATATKVGASIPTNRVAVRHQFPMVSLQSVRETRELREFVQRTFDAIDDNDDDDDDDNAATTATAASRRLPCVVELKYDGMSASVHYENGKLVQGFLNFPNAV